MRMGFKGGYKMPPYQCNIFIHLLLSFSSCLVILVNGVLLSGVPIPVAIPYVFPPFSQRYDLREGIPVDLLMRVSCSCLH